MNKFITILFSILFMLIIPTICSAQPAPPPPPGPYYVVEQCYTVLFPYPHSRCEYVRVRRNYTPAPPPPPHHRHYGPVPPMGPRPGHHPPPHHDGHGHRNGPGPRR